MKAYCEITLCDNDFRLALEVLANTISIIVKTYGAAKFMAMDSVRLRHFCVTVLCIAHELSTGKKWESSLDYFNESLRIKFTDSMELAYDNCEDVCIDLAEDGHNFWDVYCG